MKHALLCPLVWVFILLIAIFVGYYVEKIRCNSEDSRTLRAVQEAAEYAQRGDIAWHPIDAFGTMVRTCRINEIGFAKSAGRDREFDTADDITVIRF